MDKMPKQWVSAHKQTEKALNYIRKSHQHLLRYLEIHHINDLYDLKQHYVSAKQYQDLKHKYLILNDHHQGASQSEAVVGKATVQNNDNQHLQSLMSSLTSSGKGKHRSKSSSASSRVAK